MANHFMSLLFAVNLLLIISTNGRVFQTNNSSAISTSDFERKLVSLQATGGTGQTNADDVQGLNALVTSFPSLEEKNPDPCLSPRWTWIECNSDARPRVIALNLSSKHLFGSVPVFSSMKALQRIDLSQNSLSGNIPSFFGTFSNLQELNVADNLYSGYIPESVACNKNVKLWVSGNAGLYVSSKCINTGNIVDATLTPTYTYTPTSYYRSSTHVSTVAAAIGSVFIIIGLVILILWIRRCRIPTSAAFAARFNAGTPANNQNTNMPTNMNPGPK